MTSPDDFVFVRGENVDAEHPHGDLDRIEYLSGRVDKLYAKVTPPSFLSYKFRGQMVASLQEAYYALEKISSPYTSIDEPSFSVVPHSDHIGFVITLHNLFVDYDDARMMLERDYRGTNLTGQEIHDAESLESPVIRDALPLFFVGRNRTYSKLKHPIGGKLHDYATINALFRFVRTNRMVSLRDARYSDLPPALESLTIDHEESGSMIGEYESYRERELSVINGAAMLYHCGEWSPSVSFAGHFVVTGSNPAPWTIYTEFGKAAKYVRDVLPVYFVKYFNSVNGEVTHDHKSILFGSSWITVNDDRATVNVETDGLARRMFDHFGNPTAQRMPSDWQEIGWTCDLRVTVEAIMFVCRLTDEARLPI